MDGKEQISHPSISPNTESAPSQASRFIKSVVLFDYDVKEGPVVRALNPAGSIEGEDAKELGFSAFPESNVVGSEPQKWIYAFSHIPPSGPPLIAYALSAQWACPDSPRGCARRAIVILSPSSIYDLFRKVLIQLGSRLCIAGANLDEAYSLFGRVISDALFWPDVCYAKHCMFGLTVLKPEGVRVFVKDPCNGISNAITSGSSTPSHDLLPTLSKLIKSETYRENNAVSSLTLIQSYVETLTGNSSGTSTSNNNNVSHEKGGGHTKQTQSTTGQQHTTRPQEQTSSQQLGVPKTRNTLQLCVECRETKELFASLNPSSLMPLQICPFKKNLSDTLSLVETLARGCSIMVIGQSPWVVSSFVYTLLSLFTIPYGGKAYPYFTVYNKYTQVIAKSKDKLDELIIGVTNPLFERYISSFDVIVRLSETKPLNNAACVKSSSSSKSHQSSIQSCTGDTCSGGSNSYEITDETLLESHKAGTSISLTNQYKTSKPRQPEETVSSMTLVKQHRKRFKLLLRTPPELEEALNKSSHRNAEELLRRYLSCFFNELLFGLKTQPAALDPPVKLVSLFDQKVFRPIALPPAEEAEMEIIVASKTKPILPIVQRLLGDVYGAAHRTFLHSYISTGTYTRLRTIHSMTSLLETKARIRQLRMDLTTTSIISRKLLKERAGILQVDRLYAVTLNDEDQKKDILREEKMKKKLTPEYAVLYNMILRVEEVAMSEEMDSDLEQRRHLVLLAKKLRGYLPYK